MAFYRWRRDAGVCRINLALPSIVLYGEPDKVVNNFRKNFKMYPASAKPFRECSPKSTGESNTKMPMDFVANKTDT